MVSTVENLGNAVKYFIGKYGGEVVSSINGNRGALCSVVRSGGERNYVVFKRDWFYKFAVLFNKPGFGEGQTMNMDIVKKAAADGAKIVIVMPGPEIFELDAKKWLGYVVMQKTTRVPSTEKSVEGSVPRELLRQVEPAAPGTARAQTPKVQYQKVLF